MQIRLDRFGAESGQPSEFRYRCGKHANCIYNYLLAFAKAESKIDWTGTLPIGTMRDSWEAVRERLAEAIERRRGNLTTRSVAKLADDAGVAYTTLARFLGLIKGPTRSMHQATLTTVAVHLGVSPNWLRYGVETEQIGIWPRIHPMEEPSPDLEPVEELRSVVSTLSMIKTETVRLQLCRAAVEAMLATARRTGAILPAEVYGALGRLEVQLQMAEQRKAQMA